MPNHSSAIPAPAHSEVGLSPYGSHSSIPVKILPYGNFPAGNVVAASQFPQPVSIMRCYNNLSCLKHPFQNT